MKKIRKIISEHPWKSAFFPYPIILITSFIYDFIPNKIFEILLYILIILFPIWLISGLFLSKKKSPYILSILFILLLIFGGSFWAFLNWDESMNSFNNACKELGLLCE